jgi:hypothetical protein
MSPASDRLLSEAGEVPAERIIMADSIAIGDTLKNGATVLQVKPDGRGGEIVLGFYHGSEFVTWVHTEEGGTFWGHYHDTDLPAALADFDARG